MNTKENEFRGRSGKRDGDTKVLDKKMSQVSRMWDGDGKGFLNETEQRLRDLDEEGIGALSADQLKIFADGHQALQQENYRITKMLWGLVILVVVLFGGTVAASVLAVKTSKETAVNSEGIMTTKGSHKPISVKTNEMVMPLAVLAFLPLEVASHIQFITMKSEDGSTDHHRAVVSIDVKASSFVKLITSTGDSAIWEGGQEVEISLADGTAWAKLSCCSQCSAINIVTTEEIEEGFDAFATYFEAKHGRKLGSCLTDPFLENCTDGLA